MLRRLRRPPHRRRQPLPVRHRGLRRDLEADLGEACRAARRTACARTSRTRTCSTAAPSSPLWFSVDRGQTWQHAEHEPADGGDPRVRRPPDGRRDRRGHARPEPLGARRDPAPADDRGGPGGRRPPLRPVPAVRWKREPGRGGTNRRFVRREPRARRAPIYYSLSRRPRRSSLKIVDASGAASASCRPAAAGPAPRDLGPDRTPPRREGGGGALAGVAAAFRGRGARAGIPVPPGTYGVILDVDGEDQAQTLRVDRPDPAGLRGHRRRRRTVDRRRQ